MLGINICLDNTYIQFKNQLYKQIFGVLLGSPISVTIANLVMETVETKALQTFQNSPTMWKRYVDDTFVVIKKNNLETFYEHLASIKFTLEIESNNSLPFLDVLVVKEKSKFDNQIISKTNAPQSVPQFQLTTFIKTKAWGNIHFIPQNQFETNYEKNR